MIPPHIRFSRTQDHIKIWYCPGTRSNWRRGRQTSSTITIYTIHHTSAAQILSGGSGRLHPGRSRGPHGPDSPTHTHTYLRHSPGRHPLRHSPSQLGPRGSWAAIYQSRTSYRKAGLYCLPACLSAKRPVKLAVAHLPGLPHCARGRLGSAFWCWLWPRLWLCFCMLPCLWGHGARLLRTDSDGVTE